MKTITAVTLAASLFATASRTVAQSYSIDWSTTDGGGGTSLGGGYSLSGTIGQPDAGVPLAGGTFSLTGGFWSAVQMPGVPLLTVTFTGNQVVVSWPPPSTGFLLQQNANLNSANWVPASEAVTDSGTNRFIIVNPPTGHRFYRLFKP